MAAVVLCALRSGGGTATRFRSLFSTAQVLVIVDLAARINDSFSVSASSDAPSNMCKYITRKHLRVEFSALLSAVCWELLLAVSEGFRVPGCVFCASIS